MSARLAIQWFSPIGFVRAVETREEMDSFGSFYDEIEVMQIINATPACAVVHYKLRRRQDHPHSPVYDYKIDVVQRGQLIQTITVPN